MHRVSLGVHRSGFSAEDTFWTGFDSDDEDLLPERRRAPDWRLVGILLCYGALIFVGGVLLMA